MKEAVAAVAYSEAGRRKDMNDVNCKKGKISSFYSKGEEIFNAVSHISGGGLGLIAWIVLLVYAFPDANNMIAVSVFGASIVTLYTMSSLYHFLHEGKAKWVFRIFDHCTIFLLIAGTYTPYCMIALNGTPFGLPILITEWALAVAGITMNAIGMRSMVIKGISMGLYFVMGWLILIAFVPLIAFLSAASIWLLLAGGIAYTGGIVFFALGKKVKYFHSIWHLFDIAGTMLQFASILLMLM